MPLKAFLSINKKFRNCKKFNYSNYYIPTILLGNVNKLRKI